MNSDWHTQPDQMLITKQIIKDYEEDIMCVIDMYVSYSI